MKTLDQAVKDYVQPMVDEGMPELDIVFSSADFKNGVEFAQKWISVEDELPEQVEKLLVNKIKSENVLVKRKWDYNGEIAIEINCRFCPSPRIGFLWNIEYKGSSIIEWRPIEIK